MSHLTISDLASFGNLCALKATPKTPSKILSSTSFQHICFISCVNLGLTLRFLRSYQLPLPNFYRLVIGCTQRLSIIESVIKPQPSTSSTILLPLAKYAMFWNFVFLLRVLHEGGICTLITMNMKTLKHHNQRSQILSIMSIYCQSSKFGLVYLLAHDL